MRRHRRENLSTGAIVAMAVAGVVLVPVALAAAGFAYVVNRAKKDKEEFDAKVDEYEFDPGFQPGFEPTPWGPLG